MPSSKPRVQYFKDGVAIRNPSVNSLSGFAYFYTKGIDGPDSDRVSTKRLEEILAGLGVTEPRTSNFEVTLPNGRVIKAVVEGTKAKATTTKKATTKKTTTRTPAKVAKATSAEQKATDEDKSIEAGRDAIKARTEARAEARRTRDAAAVRKAS